MAINQAVPPFYWVYGKLSAMAQGAQRQSVEAGFSACPIAHFCYFIDT
jgi:hypothetical protein